MSREWFSDLSWSSRNKRSKQSVQVSNRHHFRQDGRILGAAPLNYLQEKLLTANLQTLGDLELLIYHSVINSMLVLVVVLLLSHGFDVQTRVNYGV